MRLMKRRVRVAGQAQEDQAGRVERDAGDHRDEPADDAQREAHDRGDQEDGAQPERVAPVAAPGEGPAAGVS